MSQKTVKKIALVMAILMIMSVVLGLFSMLVAYADTNTLNQLLAAEKELGDLESQRILIEEQLKQIEANQQTTYQEIVILESQIENTTAQIDATQNVINVLEQDIAIEQKRLEEATQKMDEQYDSMKNSIRVMYEAGETTYLDILLASNSFFDMLARVEIAQQIINYNQSVFDDYTANALAVEQAKIQLEEDKQMQESYRMVLDTQMVTLEKESALVETKMKQLMIDEEAAQQAQNDTLKAEEEMVEKIAQLSRELASQGVYVGGELTWPTPSSTRITSVFGYRTHPITGSYSLHSGVDIGAAGGANILSANAGVVIVSDYHSVYGNYVMVDHGGGIVTLYAHMSKRSVSVGQAVGKGEVLGLVGTTGWSTGNHLHFEVIVNGTHVDPMSYFS